MAAEPVVELDVIREMARRFRTFKLGESRLRGELVNVLFCCGLSNPVPYGDPDTPRYMLRCLLGLVLDNSNVVKCLTLNISKSGLLHGEQSYCVAGAFDERYSFDVPACSQPGAAGASKSMLAVASGVGAATRSGLLARLAYNGADSRTNMQTAAPEAAELRSNYGWYQHPIPVRCHVDSANRHKFNMDDVRVR